jgi:hypothetical protein
MVSERNEGFADVVPGELFAFENEDASAVLGEGGCGGSTSRAGADDHGVEGLGSIHTQTY